MTLPRHALDYSKCDIAELKAFILARTGNPAPKADQLVKKSGAKRRPVMRELYETIEHKAPYISTLCKFDQDVTFPFMNLAPELRNLVYRELLTWPERVASGESYMPWLPSTKRHGLPQILATSKHVNQEARDIVYAENVGQISVLVDCSAPLTTSEGKEYRDSWVPLKVFIDDDDNSRKISFHPIMIPEVPLYFHKIHHIKLLVFVETPVGEEAEDGTTPADILAHVSSILNRVLYALGSSLAQANELRSLTIQLPTDKSVIEVDKLAEILWPVTKLQLHSSAIHVRGPPEVDNKRWRSQWGPAPLQPLSTNMLTDYTTIKTGFSAYVRLIYQHMQHMGARAVEHAEGRELSMDELVNSDELISQAREDEIRALLSATDAWLSGEATAELERAVHAELDRKVETMHAGVSLNIRAVQAGMGRPRLGR